MTAPPSASTITIPPIRSHLPRTFDDTATAAAAESLSPPVPTELRFSHLALAREGVVLCTRIWWGVAEVFLSGGGGLKAGLWSGYAAFLCARYLLSHARQVNQGNRVEWKER